MAQAVQFQCTNFDGTRCIKLPRLVFLVNGKRVIFQVSTVTKRQKIARDEKSQFLKYEYA